MSFAPQFCWYDSKVVSHPENAKKALHLRHLGIYAYRAQFLQAYSRLDPSPPELAEALEQLRALWNGYRIAVHTTLNAPPAGVDTPEDLERVRKASLSE